MKRSHIQLIIHFFILALIVVGLGYFVTLYEGTNRFDLLYHNWSVYESLGYNRFQFIYNFYMILAYSFMLLIVMKDFVLLNDIHYILRQHSYQRFLNSLLKHFLYKILLFHIILMSLSSIVFHFYNIEIILFIIKNTLALMIMIYLYIFILHYIGDNQSLFLFMIVLATLIDICTGSHFLAFGNSLIYIILHVIFLILLKKLLCFLFKKGCMNK